MSARKVVRVLLGLALVAGCAAPARAQRSEYEKKIEEYNAYTAAMGVQDASERLPAIESFLKTYPQSQYGPFVYPSYAETAFAVQKYPKAMEAVEAFLGMDREQVAKAYKQSNPNVNDTAIDTLYYRAFVLYTFSFLQSFRNGTPQADILAAKAAERAQQALEMHQRLYAAVQLPPGVTPEQLNQAKQQEEVSFHKVLAFTAWRKKDYATAAREYSVLVEHTPNDAWTNYQLGLAKLQQPSPDFLPGFWHVARAVALNIPKSHEVSDYLLKSVAAYQGVPFQCLEGQVKQLIARSAGSVRPPAEWTLASAEQVNALRQAMTVKRIFDDLKAGGERAHLMWLGSCGTEIGVGESGQPELAVLILGVTESQDNLVTLRVAAGQEAVDAKTANVEVKVEGPPEAKSLKVNDVVRVSGKISGYENEPQFLLKLTEGRVNPEDIPKATPPPRRRGGGTAR